MTAETSAGANRPVRTLVYGSCDSRDTFSELPRGEFELVDYVARQSLISAYSTPVTEQPVPRMSSRFQQRMVRGDFVSSLPSVLAQHARAISPVLWRTSPSTYEGLAASMSAALQAGVPGATSERNQDDCPCDDRLWHSTRGNQGCATN